MSTESQPAGVPGSGEITRLLQRMREGDSEAEGELLSRVFHELRRIAAALMAREAPGHTLQPTALVDEAWMRFFGQAKPNCPDRAYMFAALGTAMRRILVEHARRRKRDKRGGDRERVDLDSVELVGPLPDDQLLAVDEALDRFAQSEPFAAKLVNLCCFVGLTQEEAARELGVSLSTVERTWTFVRAWFYRELERSRNSAS